MPDQPQQYSFGQPDPRTDADRLEDLRNVQRQVRSILATRDDPASANRFIARVRERRSRREDRTQFAPISDQRGDGTPAAAAQLLIRAEDELDVRRLLDQYGLQRQEVADLDGRVVRWRGDQQAPNELATLAASLRRRGVPISANYITAMDGYIKSVGSPERTAGATPTPAAAEQQDSTSAPVRVVVIDTGVYGVRDDGWLTDLDTAENREDLDFFPQDGFLDIAAGHGSFCAGIVQQIAPKAQTVVSKQLDSDGFAHELRIARELVQQVRAGLDAGQNVIVNLSLGTETADDERPVALGVALEIIEEEARESGREAHVVAAAGNFGHARPCYPAAFPSVTAVAAVTQGMLPAEWSSRGAWVDVSTIGEGVRSTFVPGTESPSTDTRFEEFPHNAWALWSGTSFAAPQVAAAIAKIAIDDGVAPAEAKRRLLEGAREVPQFGKRVEILPRI